MECVYKERVSCNGCTACETVCVTDAISMIDDEKGFFYPVVDHSRCIDCGACINVCPTRSRSFDTNQNFQQQVYVGSNRNDDVLKKSQSGGLFPALATAIFLEKGVVYGAALNTDFSVSHIRISAKEDIGKLQGSKYVQSDLTGVYDKVVDDIKNGIKVLFVGTPCQCDGLWRLLSWKKMETDNLYVVDLICHGVPSTKMWLDYLKYIEKLYKGKIEKVNFRDKSKGWASHFESFLINGKKVTEEKYKLLYNTNACLRDACYHCRYSSLDRIGNITIGDAWPTNRDAHSTKDEKGKSLILVNDEKGKMLFECIDNDITYTKVNIDDYMQPNLKAPTVAKENKEHFWQAYNRHGIKYLIFFFGTDKFINKVAKILRRKVISFVCKR